MLWVWGSFLLRYFYTSKLYHLKICPNVLFSQTLIPMTSNKGRSRNFNYWGQCRNYLLNKKNYYNFSLRIFIFIKYFVTFLFVIVWNTSFLIQKVRQYRKKNIWLSKLFFTMFIKENTSQPSQWRSIKKEGKNNYIGGEQCQNQFQESNINGR